MEETMAYCKECGAYLPDGQTKCLACGFDETEQPEKTKYEGGRAYKTQEADPIQEEMQRQREQRREQSRQWAEEEYRRRKEEKAEQKAAEKKQQAYTPPKSKTGTDTSKIFAALSYLGFFCVLPYIFSPNDAYAKYHGKQGIILWILGAIAGGVGSIFGLGWAVTLARLYLIYKGMMNALEGRTEPLPWIGKLMDK